MKIIQIILVSGMAAMIVMTLYNLKRSSFLRPLLVLIALFGIYLVLAPDIAMAISNWMGVDEAADLLTYLFIVGSFILTIHFYSILRNLQNKVTILIRDKSLNEAEKLGGSGKTPDAIIDIISLIKKEENLYQ